MIRALKESEIDRLNSLPPTDWKFNYESFLKDFLKEDFFYAFVMIQDEKIIGTGNVFLKEKTGWLANIIINKKYRGKGLGEMELKIRTEKFDKFESNERTKTIKEKVSEV